MPMSSDSFDAEFVCPAWVPGPVRAFSSATLGVIDVVGGKLADWFGLTTPRYAEYIDEAVEEGQRHQKYLIEKSVGRTNAPVTGEQVVNVMPGFSEIPLMAPPSSALLPQQKGPSTAVAGSGGASRNFSQV
ncbi:hypothetical protein BC828DRAFT_396794 [Blastocladiella britannica]|nr:hypothetical protein BC828DRAFT_396794 [Blastocladiella britannica]